MKTYHKSKIFNSGLGITLRSHTIKMKSEPPHLHEFIEIVYILSGEGVHGIDGTEYSVSRGSLLFINYKQVHYFHGDMQLINILIDPEWISQSLIDSQNAFELLTLSAFSDFQTLINGRPLIRFDGESRQGLEQMLSQMQKEQDSKKPGFETVLKAYANILLTLIFRKMLPQVDGVDFAGYIREHCGEKITLESLAKECFYNPSYFSRLFRELYGITFTDYVNKSRIEKAKQLLTTSSDSIEQICAQAGYSSKSTFYKKFFEEVGMTPKQYREKSSL